MALRVRPIYGSAESLRLRIRYGLPLGVFFLSFFAEVIITVSYCGHGMEFEWRVLLFLHLQCGLYVFSSGGEGGGFFFFLTTPQQYFLMNV